MGRAGRIWPAAMAAALALAACGAPSPRTLPPPSSTSSTVPEATTSSIDLSRVVLEPVDGRTTTTLDQFGTSVLRGFVADRDGNVAGAVVRMDRLVGDAVQTTEIRTAEDGTWEQPELPGGRYRVRAYLPPELTMTEPKVFFLEAGEVREIPLVLERFAGAVVQEGTTPAQPMVGDAVNLAVRVSEQFVDDVGVVRLRPLGNVPVRIDATGWTAREDDDEVQVTDEAGQVVFGFTCERVTPVTATAVVGQDRNRFVLEVPPCAPVPTTTTAPPEDGSAPTSST